MDEFKALVELLGMLVWHPGTGVLIALLLVAAVIDWRTMRIPNWLTLSGVVYGLAINAAYATSVATGLSHAALGAVVGLAILLPTYALRVLGAGDVKLMTMVGAFLGVTPTLWAVLYTFIFGGAAAIAFAIRRRALGRLATNVHEQAMSIAFAAAGGNLRSAMQWTAGPSIGKLPYGSCIAAGTSVYLIARQIGWA